MTRSGRRSRWFGQGRERRSEAPDAPEAEPTRAAGDGLLVEEYDGLRLLRTPDDDTLDPTDLADLVRALAGETEHTVTVVAGAGATRAPGLWARLGTVLAALRDDRVETVRLVMSGTGAGSSDRPALGRRLADGWKLTVIAPDGPVFVVPGGTLFVHGNWWRFAPDAEPDRLGARQPAPGWQPAVEALPARTGGGYLVDPIPAGVLARSEQAGAPRPGDLCYAVPVDPRGPLVLLGMPEDEDILGREVSDLLGELPTAVRSTVRLAPGGPRDVLRTGQAVAERLGADVVVYTGLPLLGPGAGDGPTPVRSVLVGADGEPKWRPFVDSVMCLPPAADGTLPAPRLLRWESPVTGEATGAETGVVRLSERWQVTVTRAGLYISGTEGEPPPVHRSVDAESPTIEIGRPREELDASLWPVLSRVLTSLWPDVRRRVRLYTRGTCLDGGAELRRMAAEHGIRAVRFTAPPRPAARRVAGVPVPVAVPPGAAHRSGAAAPAGARQGGPAAPMGDPHGTATPTGPTPGPAAAPTGPTPRPAATPADPRHGTPAPDKGTPPGATPAAPRATAPAQPPLAGAARQVLAELAAADGPSAEAEAPMRPAAPVPPERPAPRSTPDPSATPAPPSTPSPSAAPAPEPGLRPAPAGTSPTDPGSADGPLGGLGQPAGPTAPVTAPGSPTRATTPEAQLPPIRVTPAEPQSGESSESGASDWLLARRSRLRSRVTSFREGAGQGEGPPQGPSPAPAPAEAPEPPVGPSSSPVRSEPSNPPEARHRPAASTQPHTPTPGEPSEPQHPPTTGKSPDTPAPSSPQPEPKPELQLQPEPQPEPQLQPQPRRSAEPQHPPTTGKSPDTPVPSSPEPAPQPVPGPQSEPEPGPQPEPQPEPGPQPEPEPEPEPQPQPRSFAEPQRPLTESELPPPPDLPTPESPPTPHLPTPESPPTPHLPTPEGPPVPFRPGHVSTEDERRAFRELAEDVWERHGAAVARALIRMPALRAQEQEAALADVIALHIYLNSPDGPLAPEAVVRGLRSGDSGDERLLPYVACLASALRRMPSYRGVAIRGAEGAALDSSAVGALLCDPAPLGAVPVGAGGPRPGGPQYVIWSATGRRVRQLTDRPSDGAAVEQVLFAPGTRLRVLDVRPSGPTPLIMLRELPAGTPGTPLAPHPELDDTDRAVLVRLDDTLRGRSPVPGAYPWPGLCHGPIGPAHTAPQAPRTAPYAD
ncbi:hypothetical protein [Streptomyces sp. NPDC002156]